MARSSLLVVIALVCGLLVGCMEPAGGGGGYYPVQTGEIADDVVEEVGEVTQVPEVVEETTDLPFPRGDWPSQASLKQIEALEWVNWYRWRVGLGPVDEVHEINLACQAHANFYINNKGSYESTGLSPHEENESWGDGFSGVSFADRMYHFGYDGSPGWEIIAFVNDPKLSVDGWMATLYHRIPIVHPKAKELGYGSKGGSIDVMDFGKGPAPDPDMVILYPEDGAVEIPPSWDGLESPQPPPPPGGYPSGPIITVTWASGAGSVDEHEITDFFGQQISHTLLTPANDAHLTDTVALYPDEPLPGGDTFQVRLTGERSGVPYELVWTFSTATSL